MCVHLCMWQEEWVFSYFMKSFVEVVAHSFGCLCLPRISWVGKDQPDITKCLADLWAMPALLVHLKNCAIDVEVQRLLIKERVEKIVACYFSLKCEKMLIWSDRDTMAGLEKMKLSKKEMRGTRFRGLKFGHRDILFPAEHKKELTSNENQSLKWHKTSERRKWKTRWKNTTNRVAHFQGFS